MYLSGIQQLRHIEEHNGEPFLYAIQGYKPVSFVNLLSGQKWTSAVLFSGR